MAMARYHMLPLCAEARHAQRPVSPIGWAGATLVSLSIWVAAFALVSNALA